MPDPPFSGPTRLPADWEHLEVLVDAYPTSGVGPYAQTAIRRLLHGPTFTGSLAELFRDGMFGLRQPDAEFYLTPEQRRGIHRDFGTLEWADDPQKRRLDLFLSSPEMTVVLDTAWHAGAALSHRLHDPAAADDDSWLDQFNPYVDTDL